MSPGREVYMIRNDKTKLSLDIVKFYIMENLPLFCETGIKCNAIFDIAYKGHSTLFH